MNSYQSQVFKRLLASILLVCSLLAFVPAMAEESLTDQEMTDLLYALSQEGENAGDFLVLPEDYEIPVTGLDGVYSLLLIGVDTDLPDVSGRSDTMVLAVLNTREKSIRLISFMRDLYVRIPGRGHSRLNASYAFGGPDLLVKTIKENFPVRIDGYLAVGFGLMARLTDALGGIDISVTLDELPKLNGILAYYNYQKGVPQDTGLLENAGEVHLNGLQTMAYARIRKLDNDFVRVERQQKVLMALFEKLKEQGMGNLSNLAFGFINEVRTNVSLNTMLALLPDVLAMQEYSVHSLRIPVERGSKSTIKNDAYILIPNLKKNAEAIRSFLENKH